MPAICVDLNTVVGWLSPPNHSSNAASTLPTTKKYEKIGIRNLLLVKKITTP
jgi:hypothetical protein